MTDPSPLSQLLDLQASFARTVMTQVSAFWEQAAPTVESMWQGAIGEYERDLEGLPPSSFEVDLKPLAEAWSRNLAGTADERERGMVRRFTEAMAVKARLGPEYYADPELVAVRPTPRTLEATVGTVELHRYEPGPDAPPRTGSPVLIVYSVINRSYILDLQEGCSVVRHLLDVGLDVWMMEWSQPHEGAGEATLAEYVDAVGACADGVRERTGAPAVSLFGHCIGGTLAALAASLESDKYSRLLTLTAPFQAPAEGVVAAVTDPRIFDPEAVVGSFGKMPAKLIRHTFVGLKPYYELMKWKLFIGSLDSPAALDRFGAIDKWANDNVDVPAGVFKGFIDEVFHSGRLAAGETRIGGRAARLDAIACPVLNVTGAVDWIVPPDSARPLDRLAPDARYEELPGSHLTLILDPRMHERWTVLSDFLLQEPTA
ncbi:MAG: alpha/beta fold hydrolase [Proteobacteria bacterium]|nr:alpha/beta fold hydrolase [Pseudomonadota bacterium]